MDRLFLDANILFSAAYRQNTGLHGLWQMARRAEIELVTSAYAFEEAHRNLSGAGQERLAKLIESVEVCASQLPPDTIPSLASLPEKDRPILLAAVSARATHLITGDFKHFGRVFNERIAGVLILPPSAYFSSLVR